MAKKAKDTTTALHGLDDAQVKQLKDGIEKIEKFEERSAQLNADKRAEYERLTKIVEPLGYEKADLVKVVGRRKKDRDRTVEQDRRVNKLEAALGMATSDLFDEAQNTMKTAKSGADATEASLAAGNAASELDSGPQVNEETTEEAGLETKEEPSEPELDREKVKDEGRAAWARGAQETECKYEVGSEEHALWITGWNEAQAEWQAEQMETSGDAKAIAHNPPVTLPAAGQKLTGKDYLKAVGSDL